MRELPRAYSAKQYEAAVYTAWEAAGFFNPDTLPGERREKFSITMPPPNATGLLHLGHAVMLALQDLMARFHRMRGVRTLWLPGTDHAAIATQNVVEKMILKAEGRRRTDFGREEFVRRVNQFAQSSRETIRAQVRAMGASCDWSRERYTLDRGLSRAVREVFVRMYREGLIYRGKRIVNWCYRCGTTLADDEVEYQEARGKLYFITYGPVVVATTRPETKLGDTALAVHPKDGRYRSLISRELDVVLGKVTVHVKVIADGAVDQGFGTGVIGVTPAHSFEDSQIAQRHHLPAVQVIGQDGRMTQAAGPYAGMRVLEAREQFVKDLGSQVEKIEDHTHSLSVCYRCSTPVEPMPLEQWFVAVDKPFRRGWFRRTTLKQLALRAVGSGSIRIVPERFVKTYQHWITNLHDWCISRQIWFGHRVPAWRCGAPVRLSMGFAGDVVPQLARGKRTTYRLRDHGFKVGDRVAFVDSETGRTFGYGTMTSCARATVAELPLDDAAHYTTYRTRAELVAALAKRYPGRQVTPGTTAYIYGYEFAPLAAAGSQGCGSWHVTAREPVQLIVTRHGLTDWNRESRIQGVTDVPLDERSVGQVEAAARALQGEGVNVIMSSPLMRARQTAEIFGRVLGVPVVVEEEVRERNYGSFERRTADDIKRTDPAYYQDKLTYPIAGAETYAAEEARLTTWLRGAAERYAGGTVLVVSHITVMRTLKKIFEEPGNQALTEFRPAFGQYLRYQTVGPCPRCGSWQLQQDEDTLDTWFSSGLWTFSTLGWPERTRDLAAFHPTDVLETSYDILFFWVARMIMLTSYALGDVPFRTVYLHGLVRDKQGRKMSKSLGNGIDPVEMIQKYGADALRLSMVIGTTPGNDFRLYEEKIAGYRNFVNKLWNICRFALLAVPSPSPLDAPPPPATLADRWILSRFTRIAEFITTKVQAYEFSEAGEALYDFTWHELADWYLEVAKVEGGKDDTLRYLLTQLLKLWHPYTPFVTEVVWREAFGSEAGLLMVAAWPHHLPARDKAAEAEFGVIQDVVTAIRAYRAEHNVSAERELSIAITGTDASVALRHRAVIEYLRTKAKLSINPSNPSAEARTVIAGNLRLHVT